MSDSPPRLLSIQQIELCESYLLCHMFEEAASLATRILTQVVENQPFSESDSEGLQDLMESAAMVLVQSSTELGRASELVNQLIYYFGSTAAIPVEVVLTGACVQVSSGFSSGVQEFLGDFLSKWKFENGEYISVADSNMHVTYAGGADRNLVLEVDEYLKVFEFYAVNLLGTVLNNPGRATLLIEKASLPEEVRQDLLRKVESLSSLKTTSMSIESSTAEEKMLGSFHGKEVGEANKSIIVQNGRYSDGPANIKQSISRRPGHIQKYFCWLSNVVFKCGNAFAATSKMRVLLGCLIFIFCYRLHKKRHAIIRNAKNQLMSLKHGLADLWQLAFSYQVNPLAAVQALPSQTPRN